MTNPNPLLGFFAEVEQLLTFFQEQQANVSTKELSPETVKKIEDKLKKLETAVSMFMRFHDSIQKAAGVTSEQLQEVIDSSQNITPQDRQLLERSKQLKTEVDNIKKQIDVALKTAKEEKQKTDLKKKAVAQKRSKKFDRLGRSGWERL